jgi:hypothetical protein
MSALLTLLKNGTCDELRRFLEGLDDVTRATLFCNTLPSTRGLHPLEMCIIAHDVERASILLAYGARVDTYDTAESKCRPVEEDFWLLDPETSDADFRSHHTPLTTAVSAAAHLRSLPILDLILTEARARGCLDAMIDTTFSDDVADASEFSPCLLHLCKSDFAPALDFLLSAGLDHTRILAVPWKRLTEHRPGNHNTLLRAAAKADAIECVRLLHMRLPTEQWRAALLDVSTFTAAGPVVFEFLMCHSDQDGPYPLPFLNMPDALELRLSILLSKLPALGGVEDRTRAREVAAAWDQATRTEMLVALASLADTGGVTAIGDVCGWLLRTSRLRAFAMALKLGFPLDGLAVLRGPIAAAPARAVIAAMEAADPGGVPAVRRSIRDAFSFTFSQDIASNTDPLDFMKLGRLPVARILIEAGAMIEHCPREAPETSVLGRLPTVYARDRDAAEALATARAYVASLAAEGNVNPLRYDTSSKSIHAALSSGHFVLAQLYLDAGADIFARDLLSSLHSDVPGLRLRLPASGLPPCANPLVEAAVEHAVVTSFTNESARAHATVAADEEERLLAALLEDPTYLDAGFKTYRRKSWRWDALPPVPEWRVWVQTMLPILSLRWLWERMYEQDPARAKEQFSDPSLIMSAVVSRDSRRVRYLAAHHSPLKWDAVVTAELLCACTQGDHELAWAILLGVAPSEEPTPATVNSLSDALYALLSGVRRHGRRFARGLADALVSAGARVRWSIVASLCVMRSPKSPAELPGEVVRALRWALLSLR